MPQIGDTNLEEGELLKTEAENDFVLKRRKKSKENLKKKS